MNIIVRMKKSKMKKKLLLQLLMVAFFLCIIDNVSTAKDELTSETIALGDLIQIAFENNPDIQSAKTEWGQVIQQYPQETVLEDPMIEFGYFVQSVDTRMEKTVFSLGINQQIPFPGTLRQKGRVIEKEIEIAKLQYEIAIRNVISDLKNAVYEMHYLEGAIDVTKHNQDLLQEILSYSNVQYSRQESNLNDVFQAESQLAQLDYDLITLRELRIVQRSIINAILNRKIDEDLGDIVVNIELNSVPNIEDIELYIKKWRQEIRLAELGVEKAKETVRLAHKQNMPMFTLGADYMNMDKSFDPMMKDQFIVKAGISLPLWFHKNKARIRYAEEEKTKAGFEENSIINETGVELRQVYFQMENARRLVELYRDHLIPQANQSMEIAEEWNRTRQGSVSEILETQSVWLNFNLAYLRARIDYAQAVVAMERLAGGSILSLPKENE